ncbi:hypothetical protein EDB81DRAFT_459494 [Dactylonectria macrodidyma]|uniref:Glycosyl transferase family 8 protein n=1 Tax=Dactylonectria macrodidyma TaxID=307937 RepID=A0A9P9J3B6_9HYPO|nr:hypothetical protein EDB81DRAFT_459494 [Dactylonectria macrodidyma]
MSLINPRRRRVAILGLAITMTILLLLVIDGSRDKARDYIDQYILGHKDSKGPPHPQYLPEPTWLPPPVQDPFPALATSTPPPIPSWNIPKKNLHEKYGLEYAPPLLIGFTRTWPLLLQAVVSYVTAGWPAEQIYVVENTGVHRANSQGKLTLQNPYYLNYEQLKKLGVNVISTPVLMSFAQLQNYYLHLSHEHNWPYYFWSHMDILALSYESGQQGITPNARDSKYKSLYALCLTELNRTLHKDTRWANRFFAYDHLALVNREAYEDVGGWDTFIPYYMTDCDMHSRLRMAGWSQRDAKAGLIMDVSTALDDLGALYRNTSVVPAFTDPNPPAPKPDDGKTKRDVIRAEDASLDYWRRLKRTAMDMQNYKHGDRERTVWQSGQRGGQGEPFYYPAAGIEQAVDILTEAGREVFRKKWGHRDCELIRDGGLRAGDMWRVKQDWRD